MDVDFSHLSRTGRKLGEIMHVGAGHWKNGWERAQSANAMTLAAFAILRGEQVPKDPVYGKEYTWDPATRTLSMPAGEVFEKMKVKPLVLPKM